MRESEFEPAADDPEEGESQDIIDEIEVKSSDLSESDVKLVQQILNLASAHFEENSGDWQKLLESISKLIEDRAENDDEELTASLQDKFGEAKDLAE